MMTGLDRTRNAGRCHWVKGRICWTPGRRGEEMLGDGKGCRKEDGEGGEKEKEKGGGGGGG